jgi:hypothetical protein
MPLSAEGRLIGADISLIATTEPRSGFVTIRNLFVPLCLRARHPFFPLVFIPPRRRASARES